MDHVETLSERILFLKGDVEMKVGGKVQKLHQPKDMAKCAAQMENKSARDYNLWASECSKNADSASKKVFEDLVLDEERHFDQFETEMENMKKFGEQYLELQSIERSKIISTTTG
jgi:bacterioferritin